MDGETTLYFRESSSPEASSSVREEEPVKSKRTRKARTGSEPAKKVKEKSGSKQKKDSSKGKKTGKKSGNTQSKKTFSTPNQKLPKSKKKSSKEKEKNSPCVLIKIVRE